MSWLREQTVLTAQFLRSGFRRTVKWCALGMVLAGAAGFGIAMASPDMALQALEGFMTQVSQSGVIQDDGSLSVFTLMLNNWRAMLVSALYGLFFLPLVSLLVNGGLLGVMAAVYYSNGLSMVTLAAGLLPHGIFELPALVLSTACGVCLCKNMCLLVVNSSRRIPFPELLSDLLRVFIFVIAPLVVGAAFIESYITPVIMALTV